MKILIATGIFPPDIGGPASYVPRIAAALSTRGHVVEVVTLADDLAIADRQSYPFAVHRLARGQVRHLRMARTIALLVQRARTADVVLANGLYLETALATTLARRPAVAKVVGDTIWERARHAGRPETLDAFQSVTLPLRWSILRALQDAWIRSFDRIVTPSAYLKRIAIGWGVPAGKVDVVYNAVPAPLPGDGAQPSYDIVSVGRLVAWKGFEELIRVVAKRNWRLRIVGDGPLADGLAALARRENAQVTFSGQIHESEVAAAIRSGRVFVLNSSYEGLPHIVLEAMAAGVPVVATAAGGTPETIHDGRTGRLVPVGDSRALESALGDLLGDPGAARAMARQAEEALAERFSFERMISETEAVLAQVAAGFGR